MVNFLTRSLSLSLSMRFTLLKETCKMNVTDPVIMTKCPDCQIQFSTLEAFQLHYVEQHKRIKLELDDVHSIHPRSDSPNRINRPEIRNQSLYASVQAENSSSSQISGSSKTVKRSKIKNGLDLSKTVACPNCSCKAKTEHLLQQHIQTQHNPQRKIFSCDLCDYLCLQERTFNLHRLKHSEQDAKFACDQCGKLFLSMGIMKRHALTHSKLKSFICDFEGCQKGFNIKSRLTDHIRKVHNKNKIPGKLQDECDSYLKLERTESMSGLASSRNISVHVDSQDRIEISSKQPPKDQKDRGYMAIAISNVKNKEIGSELSEGNKLQVLPIKIKTEVKTEPEVINVYDIILSDNVSVSDNVDNCSMSGISIKGNGFVRVPVPSTSVSTSTSTSNKYSIASRKIKISKFTCTWIGCGKTFRDGYNLRIHTYTHTGEMQRACKLCGYTCVQKSALDKHMKVHVKEEKLSE